MDKIEIERLVTKTEDAYSYGRYDRPSWRACIRLLLSLDYDEKEIEAILRSKYMRWAADQAGKDYGATSMDLQRFKEKCPDHFEPDQIAILVRGTF